MQVVGEDAVEADVRVDDERQGKRTVEDGRGAVLGESGSDEWYKCNRETTFKGPVVGTVRGVGLGEGGWVVDGSLDVSCCKGKDAR